MPSTYDYDEERIFKTLPRRLLWASLPRVAKKVLLLPGRDCLDIEAGLLAGKVDQETEFHLFERNPKIADAIEAGCREMGLKKFQVFRGNIEDRPIGSKGLNRYDLIFLDFCGEMLEPVFNLLERGFNEILSPSIFAESGGVIACTFSTQGRHSASFYDKFPGIRKGFKHPSGNSPAEGALQLCESKNNGYRARWSCDAALSAFGVRSSALINFITYNDTGVPMVFFTVKSQKMAKAKGAGKKAWRTRRKNALQRLYDAETSAGKKAAIKRRMNKL